MSLLKLCTCSLGETGEGVKAMRCYTLCNAGATQTRGHTAKNFTHHHTITANNTAHCHGYVWHLRGMKSCRLRGYSLQCTNTNHGDGPRSVRIPVSPRQCLEFLQGRPLNSEPVVRPETEGRSNKVEETMHQKGRRTLQHSAVHRTAITSSSEPR